MPTRGVRETSAIEAGCDRGGPCGTGTVERLRRISAGTPARYRFSVRSNRLSD